MPNIAFVNGKWSRLSVAKISVEDRGFQFGDGIYEVIRTYNKKPFHLLAHFDRLKVSANEIGISIPYTNDRMEKIIRFGCRKSAFAETQIYIQVTRGMAPRGHAYPKRPRPTVVMTFRECKTLPEKIREEGVSVVSVADIRWSRCCVKSLNLLPNVLARQQALQSDAFEAVFTRDGKAMEGAGSNLFAVFGRSVVTPPVGPYILSGITREMLLRIGREKGLPMMEKEITLERLYSADELFLTGTTVEVLPVVRLNGKPIGSDRPGKITRSLYEAFQEEIRGLDHWENEA